MRKVGIAIILLAAVVGVSYLNAVRNEAKSKRQFQDGFSSGSQLAKEAGSRADSVAAAAERSESSYTDSLKVLRAASQAETDSLRQLLAQKDQEIGSLKERSKAVRPQTSARKAESSATSQKHAQILDFYRRKLNGLPRDLSDAERKLAVDEIAEETAKKFSVTVEDLDKIRQGAHWPN